MARTGDLDVDALLRQVLAVLDERDETRAAIHVCAALEILAGEPPYGEFAKLSSSGVELAC